MAVHPLADVPDLGSNMSSPSILGTIKAPSPQSAINPAPSGHTYTQGWSGQGFAIPRPMLCLDHLGSQNLKSHGLTGSNQSSRIFLLLKLIPVSGGVSEGLALVLSRLVSIRWPQLDPSWLAKLQLNCTVQVHIYLSAPAVK